MIYLVLLWALAQPPKLGTPVAVQQPDGRWKCSAMCLTGGNDDGGYCRTPVLSYGKPSEATCIQDLSEQCTKVKPPPGGCRWADRPPAAK